MGQILLSGVVAGDEIGTVVGLFVLEISGAAVALHLKGYVEFREDVLCGENAEGVGTEVAAVEEVAVVFKLRVRGLGIEHGDVIGIVCPTLLGGVEFRCAHLVPLEEVHLLHGGPGHAEPCCAYVFLGKGIVVEMVVRGGVPVEDFHLVVQAVVAPCYKALVIQAVREECGLEDAGRILPDAVLDALQAVLGLECGVLPAADFRELVMFVVVTLPFRLGKARIPGVELGDGGSGGVREIERVDYRPDERVSIGLEGVHHDPVGEGIGNGNVPFVTEGVREAEAVWDLHGVTGGDSGQGVGLLGCFVKKKRILH